MKKTRKRPQERGQARMRTAALPRAGNTPRGKSDTLQMCSWNVRLPPHPEARPRAGKGRDRRYPVPEMPLSEDG